MSAEETIPTIPETEPTEEELVIKSWKENFNVKESKEVEKVERLRVIAGVNEYKGQHLIFLAKVTDKEFSRMFFSMPAYVWEKAIPTLNEYVSKIGEIEKKAMAEKALAELRRLAELGVDVKALLKKL